MTTVPGNTAKPDLNPRAPRARGTFECPSCKRRQEIDGNCPTDGIPLRRLPRSER